MTGNGHDGGVSGVLTVREAAELLGVSSPTVRRRISSGELPSFRLGSGPCAPVRLFVEDVEDFIVAATVGRGHVDGRGRGVSAADHSPASHSPRETFRCP